MAESEKSGFGQMIESFAQPLGSLLTTVLPMVIQGGNKALGFYRQLPQNFIEFSIGMIFCFFGGVYPTLFAAVQAAENGGRKIVMENITILADEAIKIIDESKKDDDADEDKDGKKDVTEISGKDYMTRKTLLVLKKMNPEKVREKRKMFGVVLEWFFSQQNLPSCLDRQCNLCDLPCLVGGCCGAVFEICSDHQHGSFNC